MYGPNTNIVVNGSIIYFSECEAHYITGCIKELLRSNLNSLDIHPEIHDAFNDRIDQGNKEMAWGVATVNSWYRNDKGRVAQNWPFSLLEYWELTRHPVLDQFVTA
jgi:4-hydroxyacetophenone monooxygenase